MNGREAEQARQLAREKALYQYSSALECGDFEAALAVLGEAEQDAALECMLLEVNEVYRAEMEEQPVRAIEDAHTRGSFAWWLRGVRDRWEARQKKQRGRPSHVERRASGGSAVRNNLIAGGVLLGIALTFAIGLGIYAGWGRSAGTTPSLPAPTEAPALDMPSSEYGWRLPGGTDGAAPGGLDTRGYQNLESAILVPTPPPRAATEWGLAQPTERLIVRSGSISMVVEDTRGAQQSVEDMVAEMADEGAYVVSSEEYGGIEGGSPHIGMTIRVPATRFAEAMDRLADMAVEVAARNESGQDVTEEYVDLETRLESLEAARERLLEIMQEARTTQDLLEAERQLTEREAEIESLKGRLQYLAQSARLASIRIELQPYVLSQPVSTRWRPAESVRQAYETLVDSLRSLGDFLIFFAIAILPWAVVLGLLAWGIVCLVLRRMRAGREKHGSVIPLILLILFSLAACDAPETEIEHTPTPASSRTATAPATTSMLTFVSPPHISGPTTTYTDAELGAAFDFPAGWDVSLIGGRLAFVDARPPFSHRTTVIDLEHGGAWTLGESLGRVPRWSPAGDYVLIALDEGASAVYRYDGEVVTTYDIPLPTPPFWAPPDAFPGAQDWLAVPTRDGALLAVPCPAGEMHPVLPPGSLGNKGRGIVRWSHDGWLAWTLTTDQLVGADQWEQDLYVRSVEATGEPTTLRLSDDIRETYYQPIDWVPGTRLILAGRGMLAVSLWSWGVPLVTINADTGEIADMGAAMLLTAEAYDWHPTKPGLLALAEGGSHYLYETGRLALLDVTAGNLTYLTGEEMATFEPTWSPDGTLLAYAAVPASPDAHGDGETLERALDGRAIYTVNPQTGETHTLTHPGDGIDGWPQWCADGTRLLYTRQHDGTTDVRVTAPDGSSDDLLVTGLADPTCHYGGCGWQQMLAYYPSP